MSDIMKSIPFGQLMEWILAEHKETGQVFGIQKAYVADPSKTVEIFGRKLENPVGPAAGPHTQLAQNLVAAYYAGARFFELKTVQKMDGPELSACIPKPCIVAEDEAYNCEWSTELYVPQAMEEYIKGWMILHVIAKEFGLGSPDGFQFNMSCGYNLEGIQDKKIDDFIEGMKDAGDTAIFKECREWLLKHVDLFEHVTREDIEAIPSEICNSITLSTMHGCPPQEIENIVTYLLKEKHIHTYVKCNPTLLGYEFVRKAMDDLGYDNIECQKFEYNDENNENAIRRSSQVDVFLAPTAENATIDGTGENIIVTKKSSTDMTKNLIISAHYDSAEDSVGANDNGSGVAAVLELARILKDTEMPYNVKFILFSGEEKYMLGSRWYVGNLSEDERKQIIGVINIDTIAEKSDLGYMAMIEGNKRPDDIEYDDEGLKKLAELNKNGMSDLFTSSDRFYLTMATNSDHYPFALVDIPAVSIVQDWQDGLNVNDSSDVKENMDMQRIVEVIEKVTEVLSEIPSNN